MFYCTRYIVQCHHLNYQLYWHFKLVLNANRHNFPLYSVLYTVIVYLYGTDNLVKMYFSVQYKRQSSYCINKKYSHFYCASKQYLGQLTASGLAITYGRERTRQVRETYAVKHFQPLSFFWLDKPWYNLNCQ